MEPQDLRIRKRNSEGGNLVDILRDDFFSEPSRPVAMGIVLGL